MNPLLFTFVQSHIECALTNLELIEVDNENYVNHHEFKILLQILLTKIIMEDEPFYDKHLKTATAFAMLLTTIERISSDLKWMEHESSKKTLD